ncbi:hypothetical protein AB0K82_42870, partial [Actinoallomurus sp. NPDC052274]
MPKINVYLPDELAEAVKNADVPVSAICQRALEQAVRRVTAIRQTALGELTSDALADRLPSFTQRAHTTIKLAIDRASTGGRPNVGTADLLAGIVTEGGNLALHVLRAIDIDPLPLQRDLERNTDDEPGGADDDSSMHFSRRVAPTDRTLPRRGAGDLREGRRRVRQARVT